MLHTYTFMAETGIEIPVGFFAGLVLWLYKLKFESCSASCSDEVFPPKYMAALGLHYGARLAEALYKDLVDVGADRVLRAVQENVCSRVCDYSQSVKNRGLFRFFCREGAVLAAGVAMVLADPVCNSTCNP